MSVLPKTTDEWIALPYFPFKVWVLVAFPFYLFVQAPVLTVDTTTARFGARLFRPLPFPGGGGKDVLMHSPG
jgi:hypothetical protein